MVAQHILISIEHLRIPLPHLIAAAKNGESAILINEDCAHSNALFNRIERTGFINRQRKW
ncbi:hypothetical protein SDC9_197983 [bioreactor metagenome]|uniref:Uncharacterized protein n=1 Tax=bioreactor metagenome TaxID=1076179 RepID=A0A645IGD9_9ZZZZ